MKTEEQVGLGRDIDRHRQRSDGSIGEVTGRFGEPLTELDELLDGAEDMVAEVEGHIAVMNQWYDLMIRKERLVRRFERRGVLGVKREQFFDERFAPMLTQLRDIISALRSTN